MWRLSIVLLAGSVAASPIPVPSESNGDLEPRAIQCSIPNVLSLSYTARKLAITAKQATFLYADGIGGGPHSPGGVGGITLIAADSAISDSELALQVANEASDVAAATLSIPKYNGLKTLDDYARLYDGGLWKNSLAPTGLYPGMITNYTQDLLFSMERLSFDPYAVRRLFPDKDQLPFAVDDVIVQDVTGAESLQKLFESGFLFYADHRDQGSLEHTEHFAAACDAYFFISESSKNFLPLAIRTNVGSNLIYTPHDEDNDWLLAKMMFNVNDFFFGQFHHLAATHYVFETGYLGGKRTLSEDHPVLVIMDRLRYGALGIRPLAVVVLFREGGSIDQFFGYKGSSAAEFAAKLYSNGYAGDVQNNYFLTNLRRRGLIDSPIGLPLKHFPFYEDALVNYNAIHDFMTDFVNSYYTSDSAIAGDPELQSWLLEANGPAGSINFPTKETMKTRAQLVDLLTHMAHLVSSSHHAVNTNQLITGAGSLPFNPSALYQPIPTEKGGITNLAPFLPPPSQCVQMILNQANFARPLIAGTSRTMVHMFDDPVTLGRLNKKTKDANERFMAAMRAQSAVIKARTFDENGLSQGMPFVWQALDPDVMPFSLTI
ncbi:hypothetical protein TWF696_006187 [Orbilia brochopaga]|uniref:Manganese lipoxygenase n=1 Tax=Orbilia brochopaga TaxID=3140254 RepID=A0AAV9UW28_9PEZI